MRNLTVLAGGVMLGLVLASSTVRAGNFEVVQKDKAFSVTRLKVKVGDTVSFRNDDPFFHNIFSLSSVQSFDLGSFPKGQVRQVTFLKPGEIEVECAIHPSMKLIIEVTK